MRTSHVDADAKIPVSLGYDIYRGALQGHVMAQTLQVFDEPPRGVFRLQLIEKAIATSKR